jgi:hypothetical protein
MGAPDILQHLAAAGVRLTRNGGNLIATPKAAVTPDVLHLIRQHKPELLEALSGEPLNVPAAAHTLAPADPARPGDAVAPEAELIALVDAVADFHGFNPEQRAEAKQIALADPEAALECFRDLAARIPNIEPTTDDRITCNLCANLVGRKCTKWKELGACRGWEPIQLPLRCEQFEPDAGEADQRTGEERWSNLKKVYE